MYFENPVPEFLLKMRVTGIKNKVMNRKGMVR